MTTTVTGMFATAELADRAVERLLSRGFAREQISVVMRDTPHGEETLHEETADAGRGAIAGAILGGALAAIAGGALALPAVGVLAAGPLVASLAGGGAGALAGTALGALVGFGTGETVAGEYSSLIAAGQILVGVDTDQAHARAARDVLGEAGATHLADSVHFAKHKHEPQHEVPFE